MKFSEWVARYERETGEPLNIIALNGLYKIEYDAEKGFMLWQQQREVFRITQVCGDGRYWDGVAIKKACELGCTLIRTSTRRNPKAYCRMFRCHVVDVRTKGEITEYLMEKGV